jgi:ubiquinone/menaquinone biosynthesis C-methylase UbiE
MNDYPDWQPAPNIRDAPDLYEVENRAMDPDGVVHAALQQVAPWSGRVLLDLGCGTGFWLPTYSKDGRDVIGVEPDPLLRQKASERALEIANVTVMAGSAEHLPLPDASIDVVHARFAYFFGPGADAGLGEAMRVLTPGGSLVVIDNDYVHGEFADLLHVATQGNATFDPAATDRWWADHDAHRVEVLSSWQFDHRADLAAVLRNEFRDGTADAWLVDHADRTSLTYGYRLFVVTKPL